MLYRLKEAGAGGRSKYGEADAKRIWLSYAGIIQVRYEGFVSPEDGYLQDPQQGAYLSMSAWPQWWICCNRRQHIGAAVLGFPGVACQAISTYGVHSSASVAG